MKFVYAQPRNAPTVKPAFSSFHLKKLPKNVSGIRLNAFGVDFNADIHTSTTSLTYFHLLAI
jgi:hypothetical protein